MTTNRARARSRTRATRGPFCRTCRFFGRVAWYGGARNKLGPETGPPNPEIVAGCTNPESPEAGQPTLDLDSCSHYQEKAPQ